ncbi:MAG: LCP family protein [Fimbriimonadaceae bacterium]|nr:LCP family protein [Fimbriimonadaceae bacterium]
MAKKVLRLVLILVPLMVLGIAGNWVYRVSKSFAGENAGIVDVWNGLANPRGQFPDVDKMTLLLIGQDYNHDNKGNQYSKNTRADTIMLMSVDLKSKKISAVSIPRDSKVTAEDGKSGKINGVYARGGVDLLERTLEAMFDITIDHHVIIKPDAVPKIVDSLGGIEVETIDEMNYDDNWADLHIHLPEGKQRINGKEAVGFVRFREVNRYRLDERGRMIPLRGVKGSKEEGDLRRVARQQQFIRALMNEANKASNLWQADRIINTGFEQIETSLTKMQVLALATIFKGTSGETMGGATLPGTDDMSGDAYYYVLDEERSKATVDWLIKGDEFAAKSLVRIAIKNSTDVKGAAKTAADILTQDGYRAWSDGNDPISQPLTEVIYYRAANEAQAKAIQALLGIAVVRKGTVTPDYTGPEITITLGTDVAQSIADRKESLSIRTP